MKLAADNTTEAAALNTLRELIAAGLAGVDCYDHDIFVVDAPQAIRDNAEVALDQLRADFHKDGAFGAPKNVLQARLPQWAVRELRLDRLGAPQIVVPLASRSVMSGEDRMQLECGMSLNAARVVNDAIDHVLERSGA